ncbi:hypothetical protein [Thalassiella azotivora]
MTADRGARRPSTPGRARARATRWGAVALLALSTSAACSDPPPEPQPVEVDGPPPVVVDAQLDRVVEQVEQAVAAADAAGTADPLSPRVDGAPLQLRTAAYAVRAADPALATPEPLLGERLVDVVPVGEDWPRFVMTVTEPAPDAVPRIHVLSQADARSPYRLTAAATLLPGVTLPRTPPPSEGTRAVAVDDGEGLTTSPADAVARYATVLTNGRPDPNNAAFAPDAFRDAVIGEQEAEWVAASQTCPGCFSYTASHVPRPDSTWAVHTSDGGAIVVSVLDATRSFTVAAPGAKLNNFPPDLAVLAGRTEAGQSVSISSVEVVVLHVPPADSDELVEVVAAERGPVAVTAS